MVNLRYVGDVFLVEVVEGAGGERAVAGQLVPKTQYSMAAEDAADRPLRDPRKRRQPTRPRPQRPPRPQHLFFHRRAGASRGTTRPR